MSQAKKAKYFESLHKKGEPILLYNVWDSGSAVTIQGAGAKAIATSSWSVADAQGYPLTFVQPHRIQDISCSLPTTSPGSHGRTRRCRHRPRARMSPPSKATMMWKAPRHQVRHSASNGQCTVGRTSRLLQQLRAANLLLRRPTSRSDTCVRPARFRCRTPNFSGKVAKTEAPVTHLTDAGFGQIRQSLSCLTHVTISCLSIDSG